MKVSANTVQIVRSINLELSNDEVAALEYTLKDYVKRVKASGFVYKEDDFIMRLLKELDTNCGVGCTMGPRVKETK